MRTAMLEAAIRVIATDLSGKDQARADWFLEIVWVRNQCLTAARHFRNLRDMFDSLTDNLQSAVGRLNPSLALLSQDLTGSEFALELVCARGSRRPFPLITRGIDGGAFSDLGFYLKLSPDYLVLPCFHTHPTPWNELGYEMPSKADYVALEKLRSQLGGIDVCDRVLFPSGRRTLYGVDDQGRWYWRRRGQGPGYITPEDWLSAHH